MIDKSIKLLYKLEIEWTNGIFDKSIGQYLKVIFEIYLISTRIQYADNLIVKKLNDVLGI